MTFVHTLEIEQTLDRALEFHQAGRLPEAERLYREILSASPNHPMALHYLGLLAHQAGHSEQALLLINRAVAELPDYVEAYCNLANICVQLGQSEEAETSCRKAIAFEPDNAGVYGILAKALILRGQFEEAVASCAKALSLNPNMADIYETSASALRKLGRLEEAVEHYRMAIALKPNVASYHNNLGTAYHELNRLGEAIACFLKAIALEPDTALFHNNLGAALNADRQLEQALECYQKAATLDPNSIMVLQNIANVLRELGRPDEAVASLEKILDLEPGHAASRHNLNALQGKTTDSAPQEYVEELFDQFANRFEDDLQVKLEYKMPALLKQVMIDLRLAGKTYDTVVDLGCGTGLIGLHFKDIAKTLIGIDLSKNMIREAEGKGVYDHLLVDDLINGLNRVNAPVDLFISADVFIYVGNLLATFEAVRNRAAPDALFIFSTEHSESGDFVLQNSSRYAHSQDYIQALADEFGFDLEYFETTNLRKEKLGWITGGVYVLKRL